MSIDGIVIAALAYHLISIVMGARAVRQVRAKEGAGTIGGFIFFVAAVQVAPTLLMVLFANQPGNGAGLYLAFLMFAPLGVFAALVWLVVGFICAVAEKEAQ